MRSGTMVMVLAAVAALASCTRKNPDFCCLTLEDCAAAGVDDGVRPCSDGLACVERTCTAPMCASTGCEASAPVCEVTTGLCAGCAGPADCERYASTPVCDVEGDGACVACVGNEDCAADTPICDARACRGAVTDDECPSGAALESGGCVDEANVLYLSPQGTDSGTCTRSAPCQDLAYAFTQTTNTRNHLVLQMGEYASLGARTGTTAQSVFIHGHGATVVGGNDDLATLLTDVPTSIVSLSLRNQSLQGLALGGGATTSLSRTSLEGHRGLTVFGTVTASDVEINARHIGVQIFSGSLMLNRARLRGGTHGILASGGTVDLTNLVIVETTGVGISLDATSGALRFGTIARTGLSPSTGPFGIECITSNFRIESSIVWNFNLTTRAPITGSCTGASQIEDTFAGPMAVTGAMNTDPLLVNEMAFNVHLAPGSPARDAVESGPATDFEGDPRPAGARFDIGADEAQ